LLKLKKLQILGFKSFCDRTELQFTGDGIAAIVGPNGCGKSNVSDAITWVLGEQSAKSLRGINMQDVIFAGTRERKPTGMAEVSLTLIDPSVFDGEVNGEPEIDIQNEMPGSSDDWDEAAVREQRAVDTEAAVEDAQPGVVLNEGEATAEELAAAQIAQENATEAQNTEAELDAPTLEASVTAPAEVVLKIRRRKFNRKQFRAGEIMVTRRIFRSGESEYLLNGKLCRLRDIQDIFMGTGLGPESYAIIEQGRIGQILSSKPHDRRAILEEAAGITKFKTRKRLAELRLEQARQNLARVNDIFEEVGRQMRSLQRQAAKAERYGKLRDEMREKLRVVLASKFAQLSTELAEVESGLTSANEAVAARSESVNAMEQTHETSVARSYELDTELKSTTQRLSELNLEIDRSTARIRNNEERAAELEKRSAMGSEELERASAQFASLTEERKANAAVLESAASDVNNARDEAAQKQQEAMQANRNVSDLERQIDARRSEMMAAMNNAARVRSQIAQAEEQAAALTRDRERFDRDIAQALQDIESFGGRRGQLNMEFESVTGRVESLNARIGEVRTSLEVKRKEEIEAKRHVDTLRGEFATATGKRNSLETVIREHGYSTESVKRLLKSNAMQGGMTPAGVLADFLEVNDQYESVVDDFLRDELNYVVVKSWDAASEGMRLLKTGVDGRATFLVHPDDSQARFPFTVEEHRQEHEDRVVPLTQAIQVLDGFGRSLEVILPKLRNGYIAPSADVARELALGNPDGYFLSPTGETFHNVTVTGGKKSGEGPLALKRELRVVQKHCAELEEALRIEQAKVLTLGKEITEFTQLLDSLQEEKREAEHQTMTSGHALNQIKQDIARTEQRLNSIRVEADRVEKNREQKIEWISARREEASQFEAKREELETQIQQAQTGIDELKVKRDAAAQAASEVNARVAALEERRRSAASSLSRIESLLGEITKRVESLKSQITNATAEREQRLRESEELSVKVTSLSDEKKVAEERAGVLKSESAQVRTLLAELEAQLKAARTELDSIRDRRGELAARLAKLQTESTHLAEFCVNELSSTLEELRADESITLIEGDALSAEDNAQRELRAKLESMGPVNMMALDEYKETAQRHEFLETQRKDLLDSIENTQASIKEIDQISREKFEAAFHTINENFQVTFRKLFGGGQGFLRLTDPENVSESGIDIIASPPGKKLQNVLLLSGGEKALTALSLLVGIFQHAPAPFCILDEVDAPLDETNVGRFVELIRDMSAQTQFIVITHHKKTMSASPVMYGVTMQEPGVSKVVSVRFGGAQQQPQTASA
jgi:chromosome segregation protein